MLLWNRSAFIVLKLCIFDSEMEREGMRERERERLRELFYQQVHFLDACLPQLDPEQLVA